MAGGDVQSQDPAEWPKRVIWDANVNAQLVTATGLIRMVDTTAFPAEPRYYPGRRVCQYLPLQLRVDRGGRRLEHATGLTIYCRPEGIIGATAHFGIDGLTESTDRRHIGCKHGLPVHLRLLPDEFVTFVSLRLPVPGDRGPSIIVLVYPL